MIDFIIDKETLASSADAMVVDISVLVFENNVENPPSFEDLIKKGRRFKLSLASQKGTRRAFKETINWWKEQSEEARENLKASSDDLTVEEAIPQILEFLKENGVDQWKSLGWCRGQSFDFPIFDDMMRQTYKVNDLDNIAPVKFWNQRDVRTAIEALLLTRGLTMTPLPKGVLDGFIAHDSIHDCAKDVMMLIYAQRYALGLEEPPAYEDADPLSVKKRK